MCQYVQRREGTYYFRRPIPARLRPALGGQLQFMFSLRTKELGEAKRLAAVHTLDTQRQLDEAEKQIGQNAPVQAVRAHRARSAPWERAEFENMLEGLRIDDARAAEEADLLEAHGPDAEAMEAVLCRPLEDVPEPLRPAALAFQQRGHQLAVANEQGAMWRGRYGRRKRENQEAEAARPVPAQQETETPTADGLTLLDVADRLGAERKLAPKTIATQQAAARWFNKKVGTLPVRAITRKHVLLFKDTLIAEGQSAANINTKLSRIAALLSWSVSNDLTTENAALRISVADPNAGFNRRLPYDLASLHAIFTSPVFVAGARPVQGRGEAAYWLPLLALFTGARLEELAQLRVADVAERDYPDADGRMRSAWFIRITADKEDGLKVKNASSERTIPVHHELMRLGFVIYVRSLPKDGRLFPKLPKAAFDRLGAKWGEWFIRYRKDVCKVTDRRLVFHSFRHTFKDALRASGVPDGIQRQLMGHSAGDVADSYGTGYSLHRLVEGMRQYRVPGLTLPPPPTNTASMTRHVQP